MSAGRSRKARLGRRGRSLARSALAGAALWTAAWLSGGCESSESNPTTGASSSSSATGSGGSGGGGGGEGGEPLGAGGFPDACDKLCSKFEALECEIFDCANRCEEWIEHAGDCGLEMARELDCIGEKTFECGQDVCRDEFAALDACAGGVDCFEEACKSTSAAGVDTCECSTGCSNGRIRITCVTNEAEDTTCECFVDDRKVAECLNGVDYCDLWWGCCAPHF